MKRFAIFFSLILICLTATATAFGQREARRRRQEGLRVQSGWDVESATPDGSNPILYRFTPDATVTVLSGSGPESELREIASAVYTLDNPKAPKVIFVKATRRAAASPRAQPRWRSPGTMTHR